jgi:phosphoribosylglycinamide formyltransferase-1
VGGCTVHFVDYGEDTGPIIAQKAFEIGEEDRLEDVRKKGLALEWELYPACIRWFAEGRLATARRRFPLHGGGTVERTVVIRSGG